MRQKPLARNHQLRLASLLAGFLVVLLAGCDSGLLTTSHERVGRPNPDADIHRAVLPGQYAHFFIHAHQDDWQLFMGDRAQTSYANANEVVFIYLTAGDANQNQAYWTTRERAARTSGDSLIGSAGTWTCAPQTVNNHSINRCVRGKVVHYFMRLPDGGPAGEGWSGRGSLSMLRDGQQATIAALDGSTTYTSWTDLHTTVRAIIDLESANQGAPYVEVSAPDYDRTINPGDHLDHYATADAVRAASLTRAWNMTWFIDYRIQQMPQNLTQAVHDVKQKLFYAYDYVMGPAGYGANRFEPEYQAWLWRSYSRTIVNVPTPPPAAPSGLTAVGVGSRRIDLAWTDNATNEVGYYVERAPDVGGAAGPYTQIASLGANATSYASSGLDPSTTYWYRVRANGNAGNSDYSSETSAATKAPYPAPTNLATDGGCTFTDSFYMQWTYNSSDALGVEIYRAPQVNGAPGTFVFDQLRSIDRALPTPIMGLSPNTTYYYQIRAYTAVDTSAFSNVLEVHTQSLLAAPTNLTAQAVGATQINLTWTDNATDETAYRVQRAPDNNGAPGTWTDRETLAANATSYSDAGIASGTRYWYRVSPYRSCVPFAWSPNASATTGTLPPVAPTNLVASATSYSQINLTWTDNANNESGFTVERAPDVAGAPGTFAALQDLPANTTSFASSGLSGSTRYWYRVRAFNAGNTSTYSNSASATTLAPPPGRTDFYVHAHQDDWTLFMSDRAAASYGAASKLVFVYTTAGDANLGTAYWTTRETAARVATDSLMGSAGTWTCASQVTNGHSLRRCVRGKVVSYFLRLPDGNLTGEGWGSRGSLNMLRDGQQASIAAIDGSTTYSSWADFTNTMRALISFESSSEGPTVNVNAPDFDRTINPGDHPDHTATADAVVAATNGMSGWTKSWFVDYRTQNMAVNLTQAAHDLKQKIFYGYDYVMGGAGYGSNRFESEYQAWLWRTYLRTP